MKRIACLTLVLLAACGTPQEQCIARETRDLRVLDRLIVETQGNIDRGYALVEVSVLRDRWALCEGSPPVKGDPVAKPRMCLDDYVDTETRPKAINLREETDKLSGMKAKRAVLARTAERQIAACRATYPE
jgi:hypothetical protein